MILYHYTSTMHLPRIEADGYLKVTESNISMRRTHAGPDVVWLTSDRKPNAEAHGLSGSAVDKTAVRITVEIPDSEATPWLTWSRKHGITKAWATILESGRRAEAWYVVERRIERGQWKAVEVSPGYHGAGND